MKFAKEYKYESDVTIRPSINFEERGHGEKFNVSYNGEEFEIGIWEYDKIYSYEGLYDPIYCDILKEVAPYEATNMLTNILNSISIQKNNLCILDLGAGSGIAGEILKQNIPSAQIIGCDISPNAKKETERIRPEIYTEYFVEAISTHSKSKTLSSYDFDVHFIFSASGGSDDDDYKDVMTDCYQALLNASKKGTLFVFNTREVLTKGQKEIVSLLKEQCKVIKEKLSFYRFLLSGTPVFTKYYVLEKL